MKLENAGQLTERGDSPFKQLLRDTYTERSEEDIQQATEYLEAVVDWLESGEVEEALVKTIDLIQEMIKWDEVVHDKHPGWDVPNWFERMFD